ncbi:MAG: AmmeMemoRadiSam system protein A [Chlamydiota bacterium]
MEEKKLVNLARQAIESEFGRQYDPAPFRENFTEERGVFVTLSTYPDNKLRGCIGQPMATYPLSQAVEEAAKSAAFHDPRFPSLREEELELITIELSILTKPQELQCPAEQRDQHIIIGQDGLIIKHGWSQGLLLPQVATEYHMSAHEFLEQVALKAGLPPKTAFDEEATIFTFQARIWKESQPHGKIIAKEL